MVAILLILAIVVGVYCIWSKFFKTPKMNNMVLVTGGVKSGKLTFSFHVAWSKFKQNRRAVRFRNFFAKMFGKPLVEEPLFYTTIPVAVPHVLLTRELLMREHRFAYKSVIWVDEASILCDSMTYKDLDVNDRLLLFNKLIAHETKGGTIVYNTQSIADLHYAVKRCVNEVFYVHDTFKWLPFFLVCTVREERYSEDGTAVSTYDDDIEKTVRRVIVPKSVWKKFDCYAYSSMTDDLYVEDNVVSATSLKAKGILSFNERHNKTIEEVNKNEKEKH